MIINEQKNLDNLVCPKCFGQIKLNDAVKKKKFICLECGKKYSFIDNTPCLLIKPIDYSNQEIGSDRIINHLKVLFKKYPKVFSLFYYTTGASFVGKSADQAIKKLDSDKLIVSLGSGVKKIREDVVNIDFYPFSNVDLIADIYHLPFKDNSVDAIINEFVLEHTKYPKDIVKEIYRVLKPNGLLYLAVPFVASFHSSPDDYYRWSKNGLRELLKDFEEDEIGIRCGPTSAMVSVVNEWLATLFSFGFSFLHQIILIILMIITGPLKIIDYFIYKFSSSENIAYGFYFIGRKKI